MEYQRVNAEDRHYIWVVWGRRNRSGSLSPRRSRSSPCADPGRTTYRIRSSRWGAPASGSMMAAAWRRENSVRIVRVRARHYDLIVHLSKNPRGYLLQRLRGFRYRVGVQTCGKSRLDWKSFTHLFPLPNRRHMVELNLDGLPVWSPSNAGGTPLGAGAR